MPTQCSAWSLLCLEENPSDNGCHQEKDGEVGGNDGHRAHGRSNIELPARSEIISKIWICNHERWQLGQCFASSKFRNHLTQNVPIWRTGKDKEVFPGFYNFTFAGDTIPTATFGGYLLPHLYASIVQSMTQMFPIWFTLGYDYLARSINIARVQMIQLWLQFEHTSIKQTMHDNYITFNQSDRRQNVHSTPSGRHCESPSSSFILPKYFSSLSAHSYSSASAQSTEKTLKNQLVFCFHSYLTHCRDGSCQRPTECPPAPFRKNLFAWIEKDYTTLWPTLHRSWLALFALWNLCTPKCAQSSSCAACFNNPYQRRQQCSWEYLG